MRIEKRIYFYQDWGTFLGTTLVVCGFENYIELINSLKKKRHFDWVKAMREKKDEFNTPHFSKWYIKGDNEKDCAYTLLWLPSWKQDLEHYKILAHELVHGISYIMTDFLDPLQEHEAFAYQHSYLFENIAKQLNKNFL